MLTILARTVYIYIMLLIMMRILGKRQLGELRDEIKKIDQNAFLIVTDTNQAFGRGFASI